MFTGVGGRLGAGNDRDDTASELLVLVDSDHADDETQQAATILADQIKAGEVDGATWHSAAPPE